jgi:hypothetical protein
MHFSVPNYHTSSNSQAGNTIQNNNLTIAAREDCEQYATVLNKAIYFCTSEDFYNLISLQMRNHKRQLYEDISISLYIHLN